MKINISKVTKLLFFIILSFAAYVSCVEEYWPELGGDTENLLVVDGKITNEPGPYTIKLYRTSTIEQEPQSIAELNANVTIFDDEGNSENLTEIGNGIYMTSETGIQGIIGRKYKLSINTSSGKSYESAFEEMRTPVEIEEVTFKQEINHILTDTEVIDEEGFQFYISTEMASSDTNYYFWDLEETYEYHSRYDIRYALYENVNRYTLNSIADLHEIEDPRFLYYCWKTNKITDLFIYNTQNLSEQKINEFPLHFIKFQSEKPRVKYSLLAKQLSISKGAYTFLNNIKQQDTDQDELYTKQPYQISGNMYNIDDPNEAVFGYFIVAGASSGKRIFAKAPPGYDPRNSCIMEVTDIMSKLKYSYFSDWPVYVTLVDADGFMNPIPAILPLTPFCLDCTLKGGDTIKPAYWDDVILSY